MYLGATAHFYPLLDGAEKRIVSSKLGKLTSALVVDGENIILTYGEGAKRLSFTKP